MKLVHLTMRVVDAVSAEPLPTGERFVWDAGVKGLGLRLRAGAGHLSRRWIFRYQFGGRRRFISIGEYGQPWTIDTAREEAQRLQGQVASRVNPADKREAERASATLEEEATRDGEARATPCLIAIAYLVNTQPNHHLRVVSEQSGEDRFESGGPHQRGLRLGVRIPD